MQFIDLKTQQVLIRENLEKRIKKVLDHGQYIMGPEVFELEVFEGSVFFVFSSVVVFWEGSTTIVISLVSEYDSEISKIRDTQKIPIIKIKNLDVINYPVTKSDNLIPKYRSVTEEG